MKQLLIALLVFIATFTTALFANAQTAKVIKVKGQQAIVQYPIGTPPQVGQQLDVGNGGGLRDEGGTPIGGASRKYLIGLGINSLSFLTDSVTDKMTTNLSLDGRFGWNQGVMEYGPIGKLYYNSIDSLTTTNFSLGGFFDYNFAPNLSGRALVYGITADLQFGQERTKSGSFEGTTNVIPLFVGGQLKWFGLSDHFCFRTDAGFSYARSTPPGGGATNKTGALARFSLNAYF